jgi:hypothetical protein
MITVIAERPFPGVSSPAVSGDEGDSGMGQAAGGELEPGELDRRKALLRRFRELLLAQRNRFRDYLELLDKQQDLIERGSPEALLSHVETEEQILRDIFSVQRAIDPLEDMYRAAYPPGSGGPLFRNTKVITDDSGSPGEIGGIRTALEDLKTEAALRLDRNRELLSKRMIEIRSEIKNLRGNPFAARPSVYAGSGDPSLIDIRG